MQGAYTTSLEAFEGALEMKKLALEAYALVHQLDNTSDRASQRERNRRIRVARAIDASYWTLFGVAQWLKNREEQGE